MSNTPKTVRLILPALVFAAITLCADGPGTDLRAQQQQQQQTTTPLPPADAEQEEETRQIKLSDFTKQRPAASTNKSAGGGGNSAQNRAKTGAAGRDSASWNAPTYHRVAPKAAVRTKPKSTDATPPRTSGPQPAPPPKSARPEASEIKEVGVTIWRLRPARESDDGPVLQVMKQGKLVLYTPERIEGTSPVTLGDRVRLSIESPRTGHLYVINREQYADGTVGTPNLIFPTMSVRGGDNSVTAGRLVDIPDQSDRQPFFTLTSNQKAGQPRIVGELITVLITPRPLEGITPGRGPQTLANSQVAKWEKEWGGDLVELLEMNGGAGKTWTEEEKMASAATRGLTQEDPLPQTIYRVAAKPNEPVMVTVQLLYGEPTDSKGASQNSVPPE